MLIIVTCPTMHQLSIMEHLPQNAPVAILTYATQSYIDLTIYNSLNFAY